MFTAFSHFQNCGHGDKSDTCRNGHTVDVVVPAAGSYTFGSRTCGPCSSAPGTTPGGGWFVVQLGSSPGNLRAVASVQNTDSYTLPQSVLTGGTNYWRIMATGEWSTTYSDTWSFNAPPPKVTVSGTVYDDPLGMAGGMNKCTGPSGNPIKPGGGSKVRVNPDGREGAVEGNGSYQVSQVVETGAKTIVLSGMDSSYQCSCPGSCQYYSVNLQISGTTGWNFYVSDILSKWAQVVGGHVHGQTGAIVEVPQNNYFLIKGSFTNEPGAASKTSGSITTLPGQLSTTNWKLTDAMSLSTWRYSYQRLWVRAGSPTTEPPVSGSPPEPGIYRKTGDYTISGGGWQNLTGSRVILVDGDLTIRNKVTLAGSSDFLAFIVKGDINVDPAVGDSPVTSPTSAQADLVGAFLAEGDWSSGSSSDGYDNKQLVIYGTIAADIGLDGSGRVRFQRNMGIKNRLGPGVAVIWNPNLLLNFPAQLTDAVTDWREVAP